MKKTFLFIATFSLVILTSVSLWAAPNLSVNQSTYEFGSVPEGTIIRHNFILKNNGDEPLLIKKVITGWGCSTVSYDKEIPRAGEGTIVISVKTQGYGGKTLAKAITVQTNDPQKGEISLRIRGNVEKIAAISSETIRLDGAPDGDLSEIVTITPSENYNFKILSSSVSNGDNIDVELKTKLDENKTSEKPMWEIHIKNIRKTPGRYYETIYLVTDFKLMPKLTIRVFGNIKLKDKSQTSKWTQRILKLLYLIVMA